MIRPKGLTKTLLFTVLSVGLGSSFLYGFNIGSINAPRNVVGKWIRDIQCARYNQTEISALDAEDYAEHLNSTDMWCRILTRKESRKVFKNTPSLNAIWTAVASVFCVGGFFGSLFSPNLVAKFGRKGTLILNGLPGLLGALLLAFSYTAKSWEMIIVGRFFAGINGGITSAVAPVYITEVPPLHLRGILGGIHQFFIVFAIWISQILGLPQILGNATGWPYLFGIGAIPAAINLLTLPFCPESPKHLLLGKNKGEKAEHALKRLRGETKYDEEMKEMLDEHEQIRDTPKMNILSIFRKPLLRHVMIIGIIVTSSAQLSGHGTVLHKKNTARSVVSFVQTFYAALLVIAYCCHFLDRILVKKEHVPTEVIEVFSALQVIYYSTAVFESAGLLGIKAIYATIGMGAVYTISTFTTASVVERFGRKTLMLVGLTGMCLLTVALAVFTIMFDNQYESSSGDAHIPDESVWISYAIMVCIFLHTILYAIGPGTIPGFLVTEMFTQRPRVAASSIALVTNWLSALITVISFPPLQAAIGGYTFLMYAVLLVFYIAYTWFRLPETKGKTTQQIWEELGEKADVSDDDGKAEENREMYRA